MSSSTPLPEKDPKNITAGMKRNENCPCPSKNLPRNCPYWGYCELCTWYHSLPAPVNHYSYCTLPPGRDQYIVPFVEGKPLSNTYKAIQPPEGEFVEKAPCSCNNKCMYNGYSESCKAHSEKYKACAPDDE